MTNDELRCAVGQVASVELDGSLPGDPIPLGNPPQFVIRASSFLRHWVFRHSSFPPGISRVVISPPDFGI